MSSNDYNMKKKSLSENLIYHRKLQGYSQESLSDKTSVGVRTIQRIEKGEVQPHLQTIKLLAEGLNLAIEDLMIIENPNEEEVQNGWLFLFHFIPFVGFIIPLGNIILPLILWITKAKDNKIYDSHGRAILNFHITLSLFILISLLLFFVFPGYNYFATIALALYGIIMSIFNIFYAINSHQCKYPLSIIFLKQKSVK